MATNFGNDYILFVCSGNTCRSPMAEAIWNSLETGIEVQSAGVAPWPGQAAQPYAVEAVEAYGANLTRHEARDIKDIVREPLWVFTMTQTQADQVKAIRPEWAERTMRLTDFVGESDDIKDPIGLSQTAYDNLASQLHKLLVKLSETMLE